MRRTSPSPSLNQHPLEAVGIRAAIIAALAIAVVPVASLLLLPASSVFGQEAVPSSVSLKRITHDIEYLASDEMGGRYPGTPGIELAVEYIVEEYRKAGLQPLEDGTYFQEMQVGDRRELDEESVELVLNGPDGNTIEFELNENFVPLVSRKIIEVEDAPLVFAGYAIKAAKDHNFDELEGLDLEGKIAIVLRSEPQQENPDSVFDGTENSPSSYVTAKVSALRRAGAAGILFVNDGVTVESEEDDQLSKHDQFRRTTHRLPFFHLKRGKINELLSEAPMHDPEGTRLETLEHVETLIDEQLEPLSQEIEGWTGTMKATFAKIGIKTVNIVGVIEGEGPNADETVVIGAHYDHLGHGAAGTRAPGRNEVHNGADDNATGTSAVIEIARRYNEQGKKPGRRLVFICFTAEEMGLLGAQHYVENPIFPLEKTVAMINFDMIGWLRDNELTVYNWNSSADWNPILEKANENFEFDLNRPERGSGGSDHLPFNARRVPNIFIHTGTTDVYHTPEDDFETIDCDGALKIMDYSELVVDGIANQPASPVFGEPKRFRLGVNIAVAEEKVLIQAVTDDSVAERAGLMPGDVILMIGEEEIKARRNLVRAITKYKDQAVPFKLQRDDAEVTLNVRLSDEPADDDDAAEESEENGAAEENDGDDEGDADAGKDGDEEKDGDDG